MKRQIRIVFFALLIVALVGSATAFAQDDGGGAWSEVVDENGNFTCTGCVDGGVITQVVPWMPTVLGQPVPAEFHVYTTPSGNQVLMPSATTLLFMASQPDSGFYGVPSLGTAGLSTASGDQAIVSTAALGNAIGALFETGVTFQSGGVTMTPGEFFTAVLEGKTDIWSLDPASAANLLWTLTSSTGWEDGNLYTYMLMYSPDGCMNSPVGCTPEQLALLAALPTPPPPPTDEPPPPPPPQCPAPVVIPGEITFNGSKVAPEYPLVVGQDPDKRGVDIMFSASVAPTIYKTYVPKPVEECEVSTARVGGTRKCHIVAWECIENVQTFPECIDHVNASLSLAQSSIDWITDELAIRYPGAHVYDAKMGAGSSHDCSVSETTEGVQIRDPGQWTLRVSGGTTGTPVSEPRSFGSIFETFGVWLKEIAIIK
jgi:hypothetical protein